jgi:hypothetical protein
MHKSNYTIDDINYAIIVMYDIALPWDIVIIVPEATEKPGERC